MKLNWTTIIVALITAIATLVPCLLANDGKQQNVYDREGEIAELKEANAFLAGQLAALRMTARSSRMTARGSHRGEDTTTITPSLMGETIRALAQADSAVKSEVAPIARQTPLRKMFAARRAK